MSESDLYPEDKILSTASPTDRLTVCGLLLLALITSAASLPGLFAHGSNSGQLIGTYSAQWTALLSLVILSTVVELVLLLMLLTRHDAILMRFAGWAAARLDHLNILTFIAGFMLPWAAFVLAILYRFEKNFVHLLPRVWLFVLIVAFGAVFVSAYYRKVSYFLAVLATAVLYGMAIKVLGYFPAISSFPFSLNWSEASRYYYASLPYARWLYGTDIPLSPWHASRYLLQGMAFWFPGSLIWFHRFWQVALWVGLPLLTGFIFARRFHLSLEKKLVISAWTALFLLQGPVYYHLLICVILVVWGFDPRRFWKTLIFVVLSSLWAGISRINWVPVPAFIAAALYLIEVPVSTRRGWLQYIKPVVAWGLAGAAAGFISQSVYQMVSGHEDTAVFGSTFTSALLWYRLLPNPTYPMGVIPSVLFVSLPLLVMVFVNWIRTRRDWHPIRILGLGAMMLVLFAGGLVVSTKIGGGSNIHNMDAFLALLLVIGVSIGFGRFAAEKERAVRVWLPWLLLLLIVAVPVVWNLNIGDPFVKRDLAQAEFDLEKLKGIVQGYADEGDVLFITQRHLLSLGLIPGVKIVPDYELLTLTEMSISNNQEYLKRFSRDLQNHRFALIILDRQSKAFQDPVIDAFAEENNAWRKYVAGELFQYYKREILLDTQGIELFIPRYEDAGSKGN